MRIAFRDRGDLTQEKLEFAAQIGVDGIVSDAPPLDKPGHGYYEFSPLVNLRTWVESVGLRLEATGLPWRLSYKWMLGLLGRDEQIESFQKTLRNMGAAGIPIMNYTFTPLSVWRTSVDNPVRGGAKATDFSLDLARDAPPMSGGFVLPYETSVIPDEYRRPVSAEEMWDNLTYFLNAVLPVAEEAGVKLALHPDDPPTSYPLGGVARIFNSPDGFKRLIEEFPSEYNGMLFCQGCFSEMGTDVIEAIRYFGSRKRIFYVHFRDVRGTADDFTETFIDEGQTDMYEAMKAYKEVGFEGPMTLDHTPHVKGDDAHWGYRGRAFAMGYVKALRRVVFF